MLNDNTNEIKQTNKQMESKMTLNKIAIQKTNNRGIQNFLVRNPIECLILRSMMVGLFFVTVIRGVVS